MNWQQFIRQTFLENTLLDLLLCGVILLAGWLLKRGISWGLSKFFFRFFKKNDQLGARDLFNLIDKPLEFLVFLLVLYIAFDRLHFPASWNLAPPHKMGLRLVLERSYYVLVIVAVGWILLRFIDFMGIIFMRKAELTESFSDNQMVPFVRELSKVLLVIFAFLFVLGTVFNLDVASVVAGLGIGGLAVALAAKESLENLFASFTIFLDKPFTTGDLVTAGGVTGTVERVGFRSTRLRTLDKSYVTVPNKMMIDQALDNLTRRQFRRAFFKIHLPYDTPAPKMQAIAGEIKTVLLTHPLTQHELALPDVFFDEFAESTLTLMIVYFVETADWAVFMKTKEEINFRIMEIVQQQGINFAFPSRRFVLESNSVDNFTVPIVK
jgi:MscS family membrane protein